MITHSARKALATALGIALAAQASTALAQQDYGRPLDTPQNRADGSLRRAAYCSVERVAASTRKILAAEVGSNDEAKRVKGLRALAPECFNGNLFPDFNPTTFRNALSEAEYLSHYRLSDPRATKAFSKAMPASFAVVPAGTTGRPEQQAAWQLAAIARCTVFVAPEASRQLILGPRNVDEEKKRYAALQPAIEICLGGQTAADLTPRLFRGFVADALLTRATAN